MSFFLVTNWEDFFNLLPMSDINRYLSMLPGNLTIDSVTIAKIIVDVMIASIIVMFTIPFRCCCFTELYRLYDADRIKEFSKESDEIIKRATNKKERTN